MVSVRLLDLLGIKAGEIISNDSSPTERVAKLCLTGFGLMTLGYVWDWFFPIKDHHNIVLALARKKA